jgi:transposase-like protein
MHKSKVSPRAWLWAAWLVVSSKGGISALELSRQLGLSYETAFTMLHKLRRAMVAPDREPLRGTVEVDETYVGGPQSGPRGRGALGKTLVVGAVECRGRVPKRIRLRVVKTADRATLHAFVRDVVEPGSTMVTDGHQGYDELGGYGHREQVVGRKGVTKEDVLPSFHMAIGNLKAWLNGTHHGAVTAKHLQAYLDEFAFRYNRRRNLGAAFQRLLGLVPQVGTLTYEALYAETPNG